MSRSRERTVSVPVPALLCVGDELHELTTLLRCAADLGPLVRGGESGIISEVGVTVDERLPEHAEVDPAAMIDLATAPDTILAVVRRRLHRLEVLVEALAKRPSRSHGPLPTGGAGAAGRSPSSARPRTPGTMR